MVKVTNALVTNSSSETATGESRRSRLYESLHFPNSEPSQEYSSLKQVCSRKQIFWKLFLVLCFAAVVIVGAFLIVKQTTDSSKNEHNPMKKKGNEASAKSLNEKPLRAEELSASGISNVKPLVKMNEIQLFTIESPMTGSDGKTDLNIYENLKFSKQVKFGSGENDTVAQEINTEDGESDIAFVTNSSSETATGESRRSRLYESLHFPKSESSQEYSSLKQVCSRKQIFWKLLLVLCFAAVVIVGAFLIVKETTVRNGGWSMWEHWSPCSVSCGNGMEKRKRTCSDPEPVSGGLRCAGDSAEYRFCYNSSCFGNWTDWNHWSMCSVTCGTGLRKRVRSCTAEDVQQTCNGEASDYSICSQTDCSVVHGGWSIWEPWGQCSATCGAGMDQRKRSCSNPTPSNRGNFCFGESSEYRLCYKPSCGVINGGWSLWSSWTSCSTRCRKTRTRNCTNPAPSQYGLMCEGNSEETETCNIETCVYPSYGKQFVFGLPRSASSSGNYTSFYISTVLDKIANVRISAPGVEYYRNVTVNKQGYIYVFDEQFIQKSAGLENRGIEIASNEDIIVQYFNSQSNDYAGLLILPVPALSTRYIVASYQPIASFKNSILIVGVKNNTTIEVRYKTDSNSVFTQSSSLQVFETFQVLSSYDISGAVVTSNQPVAVFGSSESSKIPVNEGSQNFLMEQMIPTQFWTNEYIVPPIYPHNFYIVRIFADHDSTIVTYFNSTRNTTENMSQGTMVEIMFGSDPAVIVSNKPISVIQYLADNENMYGNPYMVASQGLSQFTNRYVAFTPPIFTVDGKYTLAITILKTMSDGLQLDAQILTNLNIVIVPVPYPLHDYVTIFYNMTFRHFKLEHKTGVKFGAILYAVMYEIFGFGSKLQLTLSENLTNLSLAVPSFPTFARYKRAVPTERTCNIPGNKTWCFQCDDITHLQYCDMVTECNGDDEVCFVGKYWKSDSILLYKSGCMEKSMCQSVDANTECQQCCNGMFCNLEGCGNEGLSAIRNRGPFCFACDHKGKNEVCSRVQMCETGQVCKTETFAWGSANHYIKGCADQEDCRSEVNKGSTSTCLSCCLEDFCNTNCTFEN